MGGGSRRYQVELTQGAERDLAALSRYIAEFSSHANAVHFLSQVHELIEGLAQLPERGSHPRELLDLGIKEHRQLVFRPYRLVYRVQDRRVVVDLIADGRRDFRSLLERRLLGA